MRRISEDSWDNAPSPEIINIMDDYYEEHEFDVMVSGEQQALQAERLLDADPGPSTSEGPPGENISDEYILILRECIRFAQNHPQNNQASEDPEHLEHGVNMGLLVTENSGGNFTNRQQSLATEPSPNNECILHSQTHRDDNQDSGDSLTNGHLSPETERNLNSQIERSPTNHLCEIRNAQSRREDEDQIAEDPVQYLDASNILSDIPGHSRANIDETDNTAIVELQEGTDKGRKRKNKLSEERNGESFKRQCIETIQAESSSTVSSPNHSSVGEDDFSNLR